MKKNNFVSIRFHLVFLIPAFVLGMSVLQAAPNTDGAVSGQGKVVFDGSVADAFCDSTLSFRNGVWTLALDGYARRHSQIFKVDTNKTYRLSGEVRAVNINAPIGSFFLALDPSDAKGRVICATNVLGASSVAKLAAMVMDGDTTLVVEDAGMWRTVQPGNYIAFDAKADNSDLPNFDLSAEIKADGVKRLPDGKLELTLAAPLSLSYPAGTWVRLHRMGPSNIYTAGEKQLTTQWQRLSGIISGVHPANAFGPKKWYKSTVAAQVVIFLNAPKQDGGKLEFRNVKVEEVEGENKVSLSNPEFSCVHGFCGTAVVFCSGAVATGTKCCSERPTIGVPIRLGDEYQRPAKRFSRG